MDAEQFLDDFVEAEGAQAALLLIAANPTEKSEAAFNVWIIYVDPVKDTVRYEHDFAPHEGELPLHEFVAGLRARLDAAHGSREP